MSLSPFIYTVGLRVFDLHDCCKVLKSMICTKNLAHVKGSVAPLLLSWLLLGDMEIFSAHRATWVLFAGSALGSADNRKWI